MCAAGVYGCVLTLGPMTEQQVKVLGVSMSGVRVEADVEGSRFSGERVGAELQVNPGFYSDQTHIILSSQHSTAELSVYGGTGLLQHLQVRQHVAPPHALCLGFVMEKGFSIDGRFKHFHKQNHTTCNVTRSRENSDPLLWTFLIWAVFESRRRPSAPLCKLCSLLAWTCR